MSRTKIILINLAIAAMLALCPALSVADIIGPSDTGVDPVDDSDSNTEDDTDDGDDEGEDVNCSFVANGSSSVPIHLIVAAGLISLGLFVRRRSRD